MTPIRYALPAAAALAAALAVAAPLVPAVHAAVPAAGPGGSVATARLAGANRYATSVAISRHQFPNGAKSVYLVDGSAFADAVAAGAVTDGPILLVPGKGTVPDAVLTEIRRLGSPTVCAVGSTATVSDAVLRAAAQGRPTARLGGANRYETAAIVSRHVYPTATKGLAMVVNSTPLVDGVVAGQLPGAILPVPATGTAPAAVKNEIARLRATPVAAVGGPTGISDGVLRSTTSGATTRIAGKNRYETAIALAKKAFENQHPTTVYLARSDVFADALASGVLTKGPVLLVPTTGALPASVATYLKDLAPKEVIALGGTPSISDAMLTAARDAAAGRAPYADAVLKNPYPSKDQLAAGWTVESQAPAAPDVTCDVSSPSGLVENIYACTPESARAYACWGKTGYSDVVTCVTDPRRKTLAEHRVNGSLPTVPSVEWGFALPVGVDLVNGAQCTLAGMTELGERGTTGDHGWASCGGGYALWTTDSGERTDWEAFDGAHIAYRYGTNNATSSPVWVDVKTRYWLG